MEHVERQEEREQEIKSSVDELDEQGDKLEEQGNQFEEQVGELREEWQQRTGSAEAPGAQQPDELAEASGDLESPDDTGDDEDESDEDDQPEPRPEEDE